MPKLRYLTALTLLLGTICHADLGSIKKEIASLRVEDVAWREIKWKTCLLDGLKASREQNKPLVLWVFIDRPIDDQRCWVFAGAAREAVFSKPEVIALINKGFIPVALKAATMGNPPPGDEGQIYRELRRTRAAPQGICVMNSGGKALAWSLSFDGDDQVSEFFAHTEKLYRANPNSGVATERYRRFPSVKMEDVADDGKILTLPVAHADGNRCPGDLPIPKGALRGQIVGRAFGGDGKPVSDGRSQENYVEDIFTISKESQDQLLAKAQATAQGKKIDLPEKMAREFVANAYLGMLDVNPLGGDRIRAELLEEAIHFTAIKESANRLVVSGTSKVKAKNREGIPSDAGRIWSHEVELKWEGFIELGEKGVGKIALIARGDEQLKWGGPGSAVSDDAVENPVAFLLGGRPLDIKTAVRYGLTAKPWKMDSENNFKSKAIRFWETRRLSILSHPPHFNEAVGKMIAEGKEY